MIVSWRDTVPFDPLLDSFRDQREDSRASFKTEVGPVKRRRRSSYKPRLIAVELILSERQTWELDDFYDIDLSDGTLQFQLTHPRLRTVRRFAFETPPNYAPSKSFDNDGHPDYIAGFTLRVMP